MSTIEVLHSFPTQRNTLVSDIGAMDPLDNHLLTFDLDNWKLCFPNHANFHIQVLIGRSNINRTIVDEGPSTCIMSLSCWKSIGSPKVDPVVTMLKDFDAHLFQAVESSHLFQYIYGERQLM